MPKKSVRLAVDTPEEAIPVSEQQKGEIEEIVDITPLGEVGEVVEVHDLEDGEGVVEEVGDEEEVHGAEEEDDDDEDDEDMEHDDLAGAVMQVTQLLMTEEGEAFSDVLAGLRDAVDKQNKILYRGVQLLEKWAAARR